MKATRRSPARIRAEAAEGGEPEGGRTAQLLAEGMIEGFARRQRWSRVAAWILALLVPLVGIIAAGENDSAYFFFLGACSYPLAGLALRRAFLRGLTHEFPYAFARRFPPAQAANLAAWQLLHDRGMERKTFAQVQRGDGGPYRPVQVATSRAHLALWKLAAARPETPWAALDPLKRLQELTEEVERGPLRALAWLIPLALAAGGVSDWAADQHVDAIEIPAKLILAPAFWAALIWLLVRAVRQWMRHPAAVAREFQRRFAGDPAGRASAMDRLERMAGEVLILQQDGGRPYERAAYPNARRLLSAIQAMPEAMPQTMEARVSDAAQQIEQELGKKTWTDPGAVEWEGEEKRGPYTFIPLDPETKRKEKRK